jgi:nickel/cobalt transporter (NicO) family protein
MNADLSLLALTAAGVGIIHTLFGPDHYLPFAVLSKARNWSSARTTVVTMLCGAGHVLGSVVIGAVGIAIGLSLERLTWFEGLRGNLAAWLLTGFGLAYAAWGLRRAARNQPHAHIHQHVDGTRHVHEHQHHHAHVHVHAGAEVAVTPWVLFVIFVFGPCEPLIPVLMYPAAHSSWLSVLIVVTVFAMATIGTMLVAVMLVRRGLDAAGLARLAKYSHALAGGAIALCGVAILTLGR